MTPSFRVWLVRNAQGTGRLISLRLKLKGEACGYSLITAADVPGDVKVGPLVADEPVLPFDVRYPGQIVALLVTPVDVDDIAPEEFVSVDLNPAPSLASIDEILASGALDDRTLGVETAGDLRSMEESMEKAAHVVSGTYALPNVRHDYLASDHFVASSDGSAITLRAPTQSLFELRQAVARMLAMNESAVVVEPVSPSASFGGRLDLLAPCLAALAAHVLRATVALTLGPRDRRMHGPRSNAFMGKVSLGIGCDNLLTSLHVEIEIDAGAYSSYGPGIAKRIVVHAGACYRIPTVYVRVRLLWTNTRPASAFRGFGVGPLTVMIEDCIRRASEAAGLNEIEFRRVNAVQPGDLLINGQLAPPTNLDRCLVLAGEARRNLLANIGPDQAVGTALFMYGIGNTGQPNPARVFLRPDGAGRFSIITSTVDMGQGSHRALVAIAAKALEVGPNHVQVVTGPTDVVPDSGKTSASRTVHFVGAAVRDAAARLRSLAVETARTLDDVTEARWCNGKVLLQRNGHESELIAIDELEARAKVNLGSIGAYDPELGRNVYYPTYAVGCCVALVSSCPATGKLQVDRVVAIHDVGEVVDRAGAEGQVHGGVAMGLSAALLPSTSTEYAVLRAPEIPPIDALIIEDDAPGANPPRGLGEPAIVAVGAAVHNAYRVLVESDVTHGQWWLHPVQRWRTA